MGKNNAEMLQLAKKYLGKGGATFRKWAGLPSGAAYCNAFVCYIFAQGGNASLYYGGRKGTYCPTTIKWCYNNLAGIPIYLALPMDVIYFDWNGNNDPNHIGFVRERKSDLEVYTIEGNTSGGIVAQKTRTLYGKYNGKTVRYIQAVFRPHYKPTAFDATKKLTVDGYFGYNSIAVMQRWLGVKADAILKRSDVIALQKKVGVSADGDWGPKTSKAVQKLIGTTADGAFGPKSVKAFQTYLNKVVFKVTASTPSTTVTKTKGQQIADTAISYIGKVKYVKGGVNINKGVDCTGFVQEIYRLNGIKLSPNLSSWGKSIGTDISKAQPGDIISYRKNSDNSLKHHAIYVGNKKVVHASGSHKDWHKDVIKSGYSFSGMHVEGIRRRWK